MKFRSKIQAALFIAGAASLAVMAICWFMRGIGFFYSLGVTALTVFTHVIIRYIGAILASAMPKSIKNPCCPIYRVGKREQELYKKLKFKRLKNSAPTYDPEEFDFSKRSPDELLYNSCHAGLTHAIIVLLSFAPILYSVPFKNPLIFVITSVTAACFDGYFVLIQRYNRPRYLKLAERSANKQEVKQHEKSDS